MNIFLIIIFIILALVAIFTYLIILGASMNKSDEERELEDQEQIEYLKNYKKMEGNNKMGIKRGDLYYAALDETYVGSEQTGVRPVVILQNNLGNEHSPTVIVAPITSKVSSKSIIPTHVYIKGYKNRLKQNSLILTETGPE